MRTHVDSQDVARYSKTNNENTMNMCDIKHTVTHIILITYTDTYYMCVCDTYIYI